MTTATTGCKTSWEPLRLTHLKPSLNNNKIALAARQDVWHKFIVFNGQHYGKSEILKAIINACDPEVLLPVMYRTEPDNKCTFLTKCSSGTIQNLVKQELIIPLTNGHEIRIDIVLGFLSAQEFPLNRSKAISQALYYKYEPVKKILNLDNFENDKALGSIYCPISVPKIFHFVLRCTKTGILGNRETKLPVRELSLKHNNLTAIILFEKLFNFHLTKLDLRHNQILDIEYLRYFSEFKISELWLDGNPLCTRYARSQEYIQAAKSVFPHLQKLDGVIIGMETKFIPIVQTHFLKDGSKLGLIKQFVKHFFTLYDQDDRIVMNGLYDKNALYSMTLGTASNHTHKQVVKKFTINRNLLKFVDYAKCNEFLLRGPEKIITALRRLPPTLHNIHTFNIDLVYEREHFIALSVQGLFLFKELDCPPMLFNRTFIVIEKEDNEYCITNDQYHIDGINIPVGTTVVGSYELKPEMKITPKFTPTAFSWSEKDQLLVFLHELTMMNRIYCQKYLEEADWDIRKAITEFMRMYVLNDVPPEAYR